MNKPQPGNLTGNNNDPLAAPHALRLHAHHRNRAHGTRIVESRTEKRSHQTRHMNQRALFAVRCSSS
jgi:hypothetical protein